MSRPKKMRAPDPERIAFLEGAFKFRRADVCLMWPWRAKTYGGIRYGGKKYDVHRLVCEKTHGSPPSKLHEAAHSCGVRLCVNPMHLRWATHAENQQDRVIHGTDSRGERNRKAKITAAAAKEIIRLRGKASLNELGKRFGLSRTAVGQIQTGKSWAWLTGIEHKTNRKHTND